MKNNQMREISDGESIRIRLDAQAKHWLYQEKERTGKSASRIIRDIIRKTCLNESPGVQKKFKKQKRG